MYNCRKCGAPAGGMDTSCDCWSPETGWKDDPRPAREMAYGLNLATNLRKTRT